MAALLLSLLLHALVLWVLFLAPRGSGLGTVAVQPIVARLVRLEPDAAQRPSEPAEPSVAPSAAAAAAAPAQAGDRPAAPAARRVFQPAERLDVAPRAIGGLSIGGPDVANHGIGVSLRIGPDGRVEQLDWGRTEVSAGALQALAASLKALRFSPAQQAGAATGAIVQMRLCFDDEGRLHQPTPDCWMPPAPTR